MGLGWRVFGNEPTRKQAKAKRDRADVVARERARTAAYHRDRGCCRRCGKPLVLKPSEARHEFEIAHAHEITLRSHGGDPTDTANIVILCYRCHMYGIHKTTADESQWFVIVVVDAVHGADNVNGIEFRDFQRRQHVAQ
jgi:hypothetical protein